MRRRSAPKARSAPDYVFIGLVAVLTVFGLVMLTSASSDLAEARFGNSFYYLNHQLLNGLIAGGVGFLLGAFVYYRKWEKLAVPLLIFTIALLVLVFTPFGFTTKGASRWIDIGGFSLQPTEVLKLTFFIYLAAWLAKGKERSKELTAGFLPFMILIGIIMALIVFQPSTTTAAIIFAAALATYFTAGGRVKFLVAAVLLAALAFSVLVYITPYRLERVITFLNPDANELEQGYHINQSLIAIGSGGWFGVGYGQSTTKLRSLPEPIGDSIFAVIAEELGFVGASALIFVFLFLVLRGLSIARAAPDNFGRLLVTGFVTLIGIQVFVNIGAVTGLIPFTGVPLPFISFGGTALAAFLTMSGIIVNVSRYAR
jgi:cell division protein FtsW